MELSTGIKNIPKVTQINISKQKAKKNTRTQTSTITHVTINICGGIVLESAHRKKTPMDIEWNGQSSHAHAHKYTSVQNQYHSIAWDVELTSQGGADK